MKESDATAIVDGYASQLRRDMEIVRQGDGFCVVTPMLNRNNDFMNVYMSDSPSHGIVVSDLGETIGDLEISGFKMTSQRMAKLDAIVAGYGVSTKDGELYVSGSKEDIASRMNMLIQAMASVDDMYLLSSSSVRQLFAEDVGSWMLEHDISAVEGPSFTGRSGLPQKFDYAIGRSKRSPERLIKAVNNPTASGIRNVLFSWEDVKQSRRDSRGYVFLNAKNTKDGVVPDDSLQACINYQIVPIMWGVDEERFIEELAA